MFMQCQSISVLELIGSEFVCVSVCIASVDVFGFGGSVCCACQCLHCVSGC